MPIMPRGMQVAEPRPLPECLHRCQPITDGVLAQMPERRPQSGAELVAALGTLQREYSLESSPTRQLTANRLTVRPRPAFAVAVIAGVALAGTAAWSWKHVGAPAPLASAVADVSSTASTATRSIAVLPLINTSGSKDEQFFSEGLSENLIITLSQFAGLRVIGRTSSFHFRDGKDDTKSIATELGVAHLLCAKRSSAGRQPRRLRCVPSRPFLLSAQFLDRHPQGDRVLRDHDRARSELRPGARLARAGANRAGVAVSRWHSFERGFSTMRARRRTRQ
jgi:TolB-like protein